MQAKVDFIGTVSVDANTELRCRYINGEWVPAMVVNRLLNTYLPPSKEFEMSGDEITLLDNALAERLSEMSE